MKINANSSKKINEVVKENSSILESVKVQQDIRKLFRFNEEILSKSGKKKILKTRKLRKFKIEETKKINTSFEETELGKLFGAMKKRKLNENVKVDIEKVENKIENKGENQFEYREKIKQKEVEKISNSDAADNYEKSLLKLPTRKVPRNPSIQSSKNGKIQTKTDEKSPNFCRQPTLKLVSCKSDEVHSTKNVLEVGRGVEPESENLKNDAFMKLFKPKSDRLQIDADLALCKNSGKRKYIEFINNSKSGQVEINSGTRRKKTSFGDN